jgi:ribosomal protein L11 methyltransferase
MTWWAVDVRTAADSRERVGAWLVARTGHAVQERDDGTLVTFAPDEAAADALVAALALVEKATPPSTSRMPMERVDWAVQWRHGLGPRRLGRLTVIPSWVEHADAGDPYTVVLDPETAFGSGEHGSTRAALLLLDRHLMTGDRVLDLGSGSGILAVAAAKLGASGAVGIETDGEAIPVARRNAERNGVARRVEFLEGDAADLTPLLAPADLILSNILRTVNTTLLPAITATLRQGALAIFSGMEEAEAVEFGFALASAGLESRDHVVDAGWWAVAAARG